MQNVFDMIDSDKSGNLSLEEVVLYLKSITDDISEENIEKIFAGFDTSGDKVVDFEEFKVIFMEQLHFFKFKIIKKFSCLRGS